MSFACEEMGNFVLLKWPALSIQFPWLSFQITHGRRGKNCWRGAVSARSLLVPIDCVPCNVYLMNSAHLEVRDQEPPNTFWWCIEYTPSREPGVERGKPSKTLDKALYAMRPVITIRESITIETTYNIYTRLNCVRPLLTRLLGPLEYYFYYYFYYYYNSQHECRIISPEQGGLRTRDRQ